MNLDKYLGRDLCDWLNCNAASAEDITLIRDKNMFVTIGGVIRESPYYISAQLLNDIIDRMCKGSLYANQNTLRHGYITLDGGHRVGATGVIVTDSGTNSMYMRDISAINIRISREIKGAADKVLPYIRKGRRVYNSLIVSPPASGKTTILRDIARQLGDYMRVGIVDERREIAENKDVGKHTFVISGCSKNDGTLMLLRTMSPQIIITDEIGNIDDEVAVEKCVNAGVKVICTAHGYSERDIMRRKALEKLVKENAFERIVILPERIFACEPLKVIDTYERSI